MAIVGADHRGVELKDALAVVLRERGEEVVDVGTSGSAGTASA
jgi:ribose 5-phosphate isomerase RpiB